MVGVLVLSLLVEQQVLLVEQQVLLVEQQVLLVEQSKKKMVVCLLNWQICFLDLDSYYLIFDLLIFSCNNIVPWINVSGRGGHPGTYTSTGIIPSTPGRTL